MSELFHEAVPGDFILAVFDRNDCRALFALS
jgi:hypothetical protein